MAATTTMALAAAAAAAAVASLVLLGAPTVAASSLVVYTYASNVNFSLVAPYDWATEFAGVVGIAPDEVQVVYFDDSQAVLDASLAADGSTARPYPDVLFGLDNVFQQNATTSVLVPYVSPEVADLIPSIVGAVALDGVAPMVPYDQASIAIVIDVQRLGAVAPNALAIMQRANFSLVDMVTYAKDIFPHLVLASPVTSGAGINFLAWTIAVMGDSVLGIDGSHPGRPDWRPFWKSLVANGALVMTTWDDAFNVFYNGDRPIIFSYTTDKAYDICNGFPTTYSPIYSYDNGVTAAWKSIEGVGVTKYANATASRLALAHSFVDYVLNTTFQGNLALNDWVFPARVNVTLPDCYVAAGTVDNLTAVNSFLPPTVIRQNIALWLSEVETILTTTSAAHAAALPSILGAAVAVVLALAFARA